MRKIVLGLSAGAISFLVGCASTPSQSESAEEVIAAAKTDTTEQQVANTETPEMQASAEETTKDSGQDDVEPELAQEQMTSGTSADTDVEVAKTEAQRKEPVVAKAPEAPEKKAEQQIPKTVATTEVKSELKKKVAQKETASAKKPKPSTKNALNVTSKDLPLTVEIWTLREDYEAGAGLVLKTPTLQMGEGDFYSQISLRLEEDQLIIYSSSDIDSDLSGIGVTIDGSELIPFDRIEGTNAGILEGDWMSKLASGGELEIRLGFFPGKAASSPLFKRSASLNALTSLVPTYYKLQ